MVEKGKNSEIVHGGERYHIQTEAWAPQEDLVVTQIFRSGQVVLKKKVDISGLQPSLLEGAISKAHEDAIEEFRSLLI